MNKKTKKAIIFYSAVVLCILIGLIVKASGNCKVLGCNEARYSKNYCYNHTCREKGCIEKRQKDASYCSEHNAKYQEKLEQEKEAYNQLAKCAEKTCTQKVEKGETYCVLHECRIEGCTNVRREGRDYCLLHDEPDKVKEDEIVTEVKEKVNIEADSMPNCDEYETFEDFMKEWDGKMPDESDASEYWENWQSEEKDTP